MNKALVNNAIAMPGSKSLSHRYCLAAALGSGTSYLAGVLDSADLICTRKILGAVGAKFTEQGHNAWQIEGLKSRPQGGALANKPLACNFQESGSTCRLLTAILSAGQGYFQLSGAERLHNRPMQDLILALKKLGAEIVSLEKDGYLPLQIIGKELSAKNINYQLEISLEESSQFFSALLFLAALIIDDQPLALVPVGKTIRSWPYILLTLQVLADFQVKFSLQYQENGQWHDYPNWREVKKVSSGQSRCLVWPKQFSNYKQNDYHYNIEGDWSAAIFFLGRGLLGQVPVTITNLKADSLQGDRQALDILRKMGGKIELENNCITAYPSQLHGVNLDMGDCPDLVPAVATIATCCEGQTIISNVPHLRAKESNRLLSMCLELNKVAVDIQELPDGLAIQGQDRHKLAKTLEAKMASDLHFQSHNDHRIAMSLAIFEALIQRDLMPFFDDPKVVSKSFPNFWQARACLL